jgi:hypothetical protein
MDVLRRTRRNAYTIRGAARDVTSGGPATFRSGARPYHPVVVRSRLNHHRRDANDGGGGSTRTGTDYPRNNIADSSADNSPRSTLDKGRNKRARHIYQSTRVPSLVEARNRQAQALTEGEDVFS